MDGEDFQSSPASEKSSSYSNLEENTDPKGFKENIDELEGSEKNTEPEGSEKNIESESSEENTESEGSEENTESEGSEKKIEPKSSEENTESESSENTESEDSEENTEQEDIDEVMFNTEHLTLCRFISHGDLLGVKDYLNQRPDTITAWIDSFETPLIKACIYGHLEIVKELLERMSPEQMLTPKILATRDGNHRFSPLGIAASYGYFEIVAVLFKKNPNLVVHADPNGDLPVVSASHGGFTKTTRYLYDRTPFHVLMDDNSYSATYLLLNAMSLGMFDIAWDILCHAPSLAVARQPRIGSSLLVTLAAKPDLFVSVRHLGFWRRLVYSSIIDLDLPNDLQTSVTPCQRIMWMFLQCLPKWFGIQRIYDLKERNYKAHDFLRKVCRKVSAMDKDTAWKSAVHCSAFKAVNLGNKEFFIEITKCVPRVLRVNQDSSDQNLFQMAVASRKENIFNLIYGLDVRRIMMLRRYDKQGNNILHIAAHLSPPDELAKVAGAALKIQRELQWFKEVEGLMSERFITRRNKNGMTPRELFEKSHESLRKEAEEWMKYTATACSFVAALIATVTFQAVFTTPGGNDDISGDPIHLDDLRFTFFIVSDTISFFTSCTSVLIFLSILTARYSFDDFWVSLPRKMILGLTILFVSIAAMLVAFSSALFMSLRQKPMLAIPVMPLACLPAVLFLMMQYPLLKEMISSTYGKGLFDRDTKPWL